MSRPALAPLLLLPLLLAGCGGGPAPAPAPVDISGTVSTPQGKAVGNVMLTLHPQDAAAQGNRPTVLVSADGSFTAACFPGTYKATLSPLPNGSGNGAPGESERPAAGGTRAAGIPSEYTSAVASPWTLTVNAGGNPPFKLTLGK